MGIKRRVVALSCPDEYEYYLCPLICHTCHIRYRCLTEEHNEAYNFSDIEIESEIDNSKPQWMYKWKNVSRYQDEDSLIYYKGEVY